MHGLHPLSERILERLPGVRWLWIGVWALVPWMAGYPEEAVPA